MINDSNEPVKPCNDNRFKISRFNSENRESLPKPVKPCNDNRFKISRFNSENRESLPIPQSRMVEIFAGSCSRDLKVTDAEIQSAIDKADED